jgi:hypothetical protein
MAAPGVDSMTFDGTTLAGLGLTPGAYTYTWDSGNSFVIDVGPTAATPLLAGLPLFATGLGALGLLGWFRKRQARVSLVGAA